MNDFIKDTKPKRPPEPDPSWTAPIDAANLIDPEREAGRSPATCLLSAVVMGMTACLCVFIVALSAVAGYRDELKEIQTESAVEKRETAVAQYELALTDEANGLRELAYDRYLYIQTLQPNFRDTAQRINQLAIVLSLTPTPSATASPEATATATIELTPTASSTPEEPPVVEYFNMARNYYDFLRYEDAIEWLEIVIATDPNYRRNEVDQMLFDAYSAQAMLYFRGENPASTETANAKGFPGNQLSRGLLLADKAAALQVANPSVGNWTRDVPYTADFVRRFISADSYIAGGQFDLALPILERLCTENCQWGYQGITVCALLQEAGGVCP